MSRGTDATLLAALRSATPKPVWLIQIATGVTGTPYIRRASTTANVTFGGNVYSAQPVECGEIRVEPQTEQGGFDIRLADADSTLVALSTIQQIIGAGATFRNARVVVYATDQTIIDAGGSGAISSQYFVESYERVEGFITFHCRPLLSIFEVEGPLRTFTRSTFPGLPASDTA